MARTVDIWSLVLVVASFANLSDDFMVCATFSDVYVAPSEQSAAEILAQNTYLRSIGIFWFLIWSFGFGVGSNDSRLFL